MNLVVIASQDYWIIWLQCGATRAHIPSSRTFSMTIILSACLSIFVILSVLLSFSPQISHICHQVQAGWSRRSHHLQSQCSWKAWQHCPGVPWCGVWLCSQCPWGWNGRRHPHPVSGSAHCHYTYSVSFSSQIWCSRLLLLLLRWTGSNTNPNNNDGQGRAGTDRSNIVLLREQNYPEGTPGFAVPVGEKFGHWGNSYPAHLSSNRTFLGLSKEDREVLAFLSNGKSD